jgi:hypothetical protein
MWAWVKAYKPRFVFNTFLGSVALGAVPTWRPIGFSSSTALLKMLWEGSDDVPRMVLAEWYVGLEDLALLHVGTLLMGDVDGEQVMAAAGRFSWNEVLGLFRKFALGREFFESVEDAEVDMGRVAKERAEELLRRLKDGEGV